MRPDHQYISGRKSVSSLSSSPSTSPRSTLQLHHSHHMAVWKVFVSSLFHAVLWLFPDTVSAAFTFAIVGSVVLIFAFAWLLRVCLFDRGRTEDLVSQLKLSLHASLV